MKHTADQSDIEAVQEAWQRSSGDSDARPATRAVTRALAEWPADRLVRAIRIGWRMHKAALRQWKDRGRGAMPVFTLTHVKNLCQQNLDEIEREPEGDRHDGPRHHQGSRPNPLTDPDFLQECRSAAAHARVEPTARWEPVEMAQVIVGAYMLAGGGSPPWLWDKAWYWANMEASNQRRPFTAARALEIGGKQGGLYLSRLEAAEGPQKGGA